MQTKFDFELEFSGELEELKEIDHAELGQHHPVRVLMKAKQLLDKSNDDTAYFEASYFPESLSFKAHYDKCIGLSTKQIKIYEEYINRVKDHPVT